MNNQEKRELATTQDPMGCPPWGVPKGLRRSQNTSTTGAGWIEN